MRERIQNYVFTPGVGGSGTIEVQGYVETGDILVITNVTTNTIIYQFSDPTKGATVSYNAGVTPNYPQSQNGVTTITLDFNTSTMSSSDELQIYVETREVTMRPWHFGTDAIERMRFAQPESLIDADFEYGLQNTKWQSLALNNNMPAIYENPGADMILNPTGYATLLNSVSTIAGSATTSIGLANQGAVSSYSPNWVQNDYALLINTTTTPGTSAYLTANVDASQQRSFTFTGNSAAFANGDIVLITKVEPETSTCTVGTAVTSGATTTLAITGANTITNGTFIQVQTATANIWELMAVTSGGGTGSLTVVRRRANTNSGNVNINIGAEVKLLANVELANVSSITSATTMNINRGWFNTTPIDFIPAGSQVQKIAVGGSGSTGNTEIIKLNTIGTTAGNTATIARGQFGSTALSAAITSGAVVLRLAGIYQAGSANVSQVGINTTAHGLSSGAYISTQNHRQTDSEGLYFIATADTNNFTYYPKKNSGLYLGYPLNQYDTVLRKATAYTGAAIPVTSIVSDGASPPSTSTITVTTPYAHGLSPGTPLLINLTSGTNTEFASGAFPISDVPTATTFKYTAKFGAAVSGSLAGEILIKPNAYFIHRPFDGGIAMSCGSPHHGAMAARQTKKYFRYQSGKGLFFTSGTLFAPTFDISAISADNTTVNSNITVTTEQSHQLQIGAIVRLSGIITSGYDNRVYRVTNILSDRAFVVEAQNSLGSTSPTLAPQPRVNVVGWYGGSVRAGMFDDQNGVYWEYDGENLNVCKRSATYQLAGLASVQANSNLVTGDGTCRFEDQLKIGDAIVIRGMTHTVTSVSDQNTMTVVPEYRGVQNETRVKLTLVQDQKIPQSQFNVDTLDGTGPSGYVIDPAKMQMIMIQYTWYGAGFIEYGLRGPNGKMVLAHRIRNNNVNDEAFMRSGNLPCRYEASATGALTKLFGNITATQQFFQVADGTFLPANVSVEYPVYLSIENEIIKYTGITKGNVSNTVANITGVTRQATLTQWIEGASRTFTQGANVSHTSGAGVYVLGCTAAPTLTHWGSAVIMDGGYDQDSGYSFTFNRQNVALPTSEGGKTTLFLMRLSPAVSNTIIGQLGTRDLVNRAALNLEKLVVNLTGGRYLVEGILNPQNVNVNTTPFVNLNTTAQGSQPSFTQFSTDIQFTGVVTGGLLPSAATGSGTSVNRGGLVSNAFSYSGTLVSGTTQYWANNVPVTTSSGSGTGAFVSMRILTSPNNTNAATAGKVQYAIVQNAGTGYVVGNAVRILGTQFSPAMASPANDITLTLNNVASDQLFANAVTPVTVTGSGSGANISLRVAQASTLQTDYSKRAITYSVNATGDGYTSGDQLKIYGNVLSPAGVFGTNDLTLTLSSVAGSVTGGERLFAIPITSNQSGELDLTKVKQLGTSAVPGNGVYPDGPEVLAITITCLASQTTQTYADVQLSFGESQA